MNKAKVDIWVGLFVLLGLLAVLFLALKAGNMSAFTTGAQYQVLAEFDNIGGLKPRAPVKSAGVVVGRVANIHLDPNTFRAVVALDVEETFVFPADSSAKILTSGLLGEQYIGIEAGGDENNLAAGQKFARTQSAVVLESLISQFLYNKATETPAAPAQP